MLGLERYSFRWEIVARADGLLENSKVLPAIMLNTKTEWEERMVQQKKIIWDMEIDCWWIF